MKRTGTLRLLRASTVCLVAAMWADASAQAAVRNCTARLTSLAAKDATELGAKKKAIDDWMLKAKGAGITNPAWRLAAERRLICQSVADGTPAATKIFECIAVGHACSISQNPKPNPRPSRGPIRGFGVDT